tara:strand:+ start:43 stop:321 length:279 start_codon:yes stop_codon:yes gene_type:complete
MSEEVKFTEEELSQIKSLQSDYLDIQNKLGQVVLTRIRLENQINALDVEEEKVLKNHDELQTKEKTFLDKITEKYGRGTLNPETGTFTPNQA